MSDTFLERTTQLANGDTVPLLPAARAFALLQDHLENPDAEWDAVPVLRQACLGRAVEPEKLRTLVEQKLAAPDGTVEPTMKAVVLAAVRGTGRVLHLESPFVDQADRMIAEFVAARDRLELELSSADFASLLRGDGLLARLTEALDGMPLPPGVADTADFARRCREQASPPDPAGGPSR